MLKDTAGVELPPAAKKTTDLEGRVVNDAVREALRDRQAALDRTCPRRSNVSETVGSTADVARRRIGSCSPGVEQGD